MWGWCREKEDFRLFKLNRMDVLRICNTAYEVLEPESVRRKLMGIAERVTEVYKK